MKRNRTREREKKQTTRKVRERIGSLQKKKNSMLKSKKMSGFGGKNKAQPARGHKRRVLDKK